MVVLVWLAAMDTEVSSYERFYPLYFKTKLICSFFLYNDIC